MEKLIELLNEYDENWKTGKNGLYKWEEYDPREEYIISKQFGFIKWLVDNDKIAWRRCPDLWYEIAVIDKEGEDVDIMRTFDDYEQLLMYLAIQDEPIELLVSILK